MPSNKFSISLSKLDYQPEPQIHFLTHVPKVLSIADAEILVSELREVLDSAKPAELAAPVAEVAAESAEEPTPTEAPTEEASIPSEFRSPRGNR